MGDRIIRASIITSEAVNQLSWAGEVFYRRVMSIVDDFGRHDARPSILRATLYPLQLSKVSEPDIIKWKNECSKTGLVRFYEVDKKEYLEVLKFGQRLRAMKSKCPQPNEPDDNRQQLTTIDVIPPQKRDGIETDTEIESETETKDFSPPLNFGMELKRDALFYERIAMSWGVNEQGYGKMISDFELLLASQGKSHPTYAEFKSHFFNWGAKKFQEYKRPVKPMVD